MVSWPCMLKLEGDDELIYLKSYRDFNSECNELIFNDGDCLIDSKGRCYLIGDISENLGLIAEDRILSTDDATNLIRAHEFNKASVCLTKIQFLTVAEAIKSLSN
jgi:hypothetical protein